MYEKKEIDSNESKSVNLVVDDSPSGEGRARKGLDLNSAIKTFVSGSEVKSLFDSMDSLEALIPKLAKYIVPTVKRWDEGNKAGQNPDLFLEFKSLTFASRFLSKVPFVEEFFDTVEGVLDSGILSASDVMELAQNPKELKAVISEVLSDAPLNV